MLPHIKSFAVGALFTLALGSGLWALQRETAGPSAGPSAQPPAVETAPAQVTAPNIMTVTPLPPLRVLFGQSVPFEGSAVFPQAIAGHFAQNLRIVSFQATGEHAEKSLIKIVWENGQTDTVSPGTANQVFPPSRRAVEITVTGYSMHERKLFKDSRRPGTLSWEIQYEAGE